MKAPTLAACRHAAGGAVNGRTLVGGEDGNLQMRLMRAPRSLGRRIIASGSGDPEPFVRCEAGEEDAAARVHLSKHAICVGLIERAHTLHFASAKSRGDQSAATTLDAVAPFKQKLIQPRADWGP